MEGDTLLMLVFCIHMSAISSSQCKILCADVESRWCWNDEYKNELLSVLGPAKKNKIPDDEANLLTAYHEAGHTLVAYYTKDSIPINKVTIIPRGPSLGHVSLASNLIINC